MNGSSKSNDRIPICLSVAGLDPSGGAGIIADIKTFFAFGCYPAVAVTSLTFQNTTGVFGSVDQSRETLRGQLLPVLEDLRIDALKTGMLPSAEVIEETAELVKRFSLRNLVVDPVVRSTSGYDLIDDAALRSLTKNLFPLADLITPNLQETERITGVAIESEADVLEAASVIRGMGGRNVLIKGGHPIAGKNEAMARDRLFLNEALHVFEQERIETTATHGTGCTLSAAIAANLALGKTMQESVEISKRFVHEAIRTAPMIGKGHSPINIRPI